MSHVKGLKCLLGERQGEGRPTTIPVAESEQNNVKSWPGPIQKASVIVKLVTLEHIW